MAAFEGGRVGHPTGVVNNIDSVFTFLQQRAAFVLVCERVNRSILVLWEAARCTDMLDKKNLI